MTEMIHKVYKLMKKRYLFFFFVIIANQVFAQVRLPAIISSNMVLQRDTEVRIWGWAEKGEEIIIDASWLSEKTQLTTGKDGKWSTVLRTTLSKEPQTIRFSSKKTDILLENILFGEVWLCSGQSNMQHPVKGLPGQPTFGSQIAIRNAGNSNLRLFSVSRVGSKTPLEELEAYEAWAEASPQNVALFSAVGYFFASQLQKLLDVPVGIIHSSWGGSPIEAWISEEALSSYQKIDLEKAGTEIGWHQSQTVLFNAMIKPLIPYTLKGFLWYQGESNRLKPNEYKDLFPAMVKDWRKRWGIQEASFYFTQIAPFYYNADHNAFHNVRNSAFMREAQLHCVDSISNSGIAVTLDIGDSLSIHPPQKKEVADRLLGLALKNLYGYETLNAESPQYKSMEVQEGKVLLKFNNAPDGLYSYNGLKGFEIAGDDHVFYPAKARIENKRHVLAWSDEVEKPVAVRYAWSNWVKGTLYGINLLPVPSFRTDDWEDATRVKEKL